MAAASSQRTRLAYSTGIGASPGSVAAHTPTALAQEMERKTRGARIRLERRGSGRVVTVIADLPGTPGDIEALAKLLKTRCGTGGSVKDLVVELQGDKRDAAQAVLREKRIPHKLAGG